MNFPEQLKYTQNHEWIRIEGAEGWVGITDYAQSELGDIVYIDLPAVGKKLDAGKPLGTIEAVKAVSDIYAPMSGEVVDVNQELRDHPELVNKDPYDKGWIVKIAITESAQAHALLTADAYQKLTAK